MLISFNKHSLPAALSLLLIYCLLPKASLAQTQERDDFVQRLLAAAWERTSHRVTYDGSYRAIAYPWGDVPDDIGVCTDVIIRAYRKLGIDLQRLVHEDMSAHFDEYPKLWGLSKTDRNIDHRHVPNLQTFFRRHGSTLPVTHTGADYFPGDIVTWMLPGKLPHIGIVTDRNAHGGEWPLIIHNVGYGPVAEDFLFSYPITGHFRYTR